MTRRQRVRKVAHHRAGKTQGGKQDYTYRHLRTLILASIEREVGFESGAIFLISTHLAAYAAVNGATLVTFDKGFAKYAVKPPQ